MATKLEALLGVLKTVKQDTQRIIDTYHKNIQKRALFDGLARTYQVRDEENGEPLEPENQIVQQDTEAMLASLTKSWTRMLDLAASVDVTNAHAMAPIVLDGEPITSDLPAITLVWLEKNLTDLYTHIKNAPVQDPAKHWTWDPDRELFVADAVQTVKSKKVPRNHVRFEGSDRHPPQIDVYNEDVTIGTWTKIDFTTALTPRRKREILERVMELIAATRVARSHANDTEVTDVKYAGRLFEYILGS